MKTIKSKRMIISAILVAIMLLIIGISIFIGQNSDILPWKKEERNENQKNEEDFKVFSNLLGLDGYTSEGSTFSDTIELDIHILLWVSFSLHWDDDFGSNDEFSFAVSYGNFSDQGTSSSGEISFKFSPNATMKEASWKLEVTAINCPGTFVDLTFDRDNGNDWTILVEYEYISEKGNLPA